MADSINIVKPLNPIATIQPVSSSIAQPNLAGQQLLSALANGTLLRGFVVNRDVQNNPILRTEQGDVVVNSTIFIKTGSEVVFRVDTSQPSLARIITIDEQTPEAYVAQLPHGLTEDTVDPGQLRSALTATQFTEALAEQEFSALPVLKAVLLQAAGNQPSTATPAVLPATVPLPTSLPTPAPTSAPTALPTAVPAPITLPAVPLALQQLPAGTPLTLTLVDVELPPLPIAVSSIPTAPGLASLLPPPAPNALNTTTTLTTQNTPTAPIIANAAADIAELVGTPPAPPPSALPPSVVPPTILPQASTPLPALEVANLPPALAAALYASGEPAPSVPAQPFTGATATFPRSANAYAPAALPIAPALAAPPITSPTTPAAITSAASPVAQPALPPAATGVTGGPGPTAQAKPPATNNVTLPATVIGHGEDGSTILHTPFGTVKTYTAQPLPTGSLLQVRAEIAPHITPDVIATLSSSVPLPRAAAPASYDYLAQAVTQLQTADPATLTALSNQLPVLGPKFISGLLYFLSAVKTGDIKSQLSPRLISLLETASPGLLSRLGADVRDLNQQWTQSPLSDWKGITFPLLYGGEVHPVRFYVRDESGGGEQTKVSAIKGGQRFLLDLHLSALGDMQLDGFVREGQPSKSFELYLRSEQPLDLELSQQIRGIFETSLGATGLGGQIVFQEGAEHFVRPAAKPPAAPTDGTPNTILA